MTEETVPYVNINKIAEYFNVSVSTVRKWVHSGQVPKSTYINVGEVYRFRLADVEAALSAKEPKTQKKRENN